MTELLVLGIGSPFGDDRLGWEVVQLLQQNAALQHYPPERLQMQCCDRPGLYLLELIKPARAVFIIDAVQSAERIGTVLQLNQDELLALNSPSSSHSFGLAEAVQLGRALQVLPSTLRFYGIGILALDGAFERSEIVRQAIPRLAEKIQREVVRLLNQGSVS